MHTIILERCLTELTMEAPRLDYIRGMLETLVSIETPVISTPTPFLAPFTTPTVTGTEDPLSTKIFTDVVQ